MPASSIISAMLTWPFKIVTHNGVRPEFIKALELVLLHKTILTNVNITL